MQKAPMIRLSLFVLMVSCFVHLCVAEQGLRGQSNTALADGSVLMLGGFDSSGTPVQDASLVTASSRQAAKLGTGLTFARAGHTATVLPDGTVLIFGGV